MSLADDIASEAVPKGPTCSVRALLARLPEDDAAALERAMADEFTYSTVISRALKKNGHHVQSQTLDRHRRRECKCP